jgi:hypothetical protein
MVLFRMMPPLPPVALAEQHMRPAHHASPGKEPKQRVDIQLQIAFAKDVAHLVAAAHAAVNLFLRGTHADNTFNDSSPHHSL